jgi:Dolichyl-phosphate-mannose-protein mannosyltransferase
VTLPIFGAGSSLMTIDAPFTCCWGWALVVGHQAIFRRSSWAWPCLGLLVGVGMLAKYTMVLWLPCAGLFLIFSPQHRRLLREPGFWVAAVLAASCCLPILVWNSQHDWVTFRHMQGHAGLDEPNVLHWKGPVDYVAGQFAIFLAYWFGAWLIAMIAHRPGKGPSPGVDYLWWMSAPVFVFFLLFSVKNGGGEPNWPVVAYESGLVLTVGWLAEQLRSPAAWYRRATWVGLAGACSLGLAVCVIMYHADWVQPLLLRVSGPPSEAQPMPLRRLDPTCRLRGWRRLASEVDAQRAALRSQGIDPVIAATGWTMPGEMGFYCAGHPTVYSLGLGLGDRHSQYDFWHPNPIADPERFRGRTFVVVGSCDPKLIIPAFDVIEMPRTVVYEENGQPIASWPIAVCRGFRGFSSSGSELPSF